MTEQHSITPPPELVQQWTTEYTKTKPNCLGTEFVATRAAQYGADQELRAVCQLLFSDPSVSYTLSEIRAARRPKPPSLKEQAIAVLEDANLDSTHYNILLRALEQLDD
jgi:hypothetical protein